VWVWVWVWVFGGEVEVWIYVSWFTCRGLQAATDVSYNL
jgi:hypothetical protein